MNYYSFPSGLIHYLMVTGLLGIGLIAGTAGETRASELEFKPSLAVSEEVNDNIYQTSSNKQTDYITHVLPGATLHYLSPVWTWDAADNFDYSKYALRKESDQYINNANVAGKITLIDKFMYLDLTDAYHRMLLAVAQDVTTQSSLFINQTNQNIATVSPYLSWRLGEKSTLKTGYRYTDTRYWGGGIDQFGHSAFADYNYELTPKISLSAGYAFSRIETIPIRYDEHDAYIGFNYKYGEKSSLFGKIGNSWQQFNTGENVSFVFWDAGIIHDLGIATATLESSVQTTADPLAVSTKMTNYTAKLDKVLKRGAVGFSSSYSVYENTQSEENSQRKLSFSGNGRYEIMESTVATLAVTAERYYQQNTLTNFLYHLNASSGLSYTFNHDIILSLNYTYDTYRTALNDATGAMEINRGIVKIQKNF